MTAVTGRRRGKRKQFLIIVRKKEDAGNWKRNHSKALCRELALEQAMDLMYDRLQREWRVIIDYRQNLQTQTTTAWNKYHLMEDQLVQSWTVFWKLIAIRTRHFEASHQLSSVYYKSQGTLLHVNFAKPNQVQVSCT
jgi:hypothetical protein